jgi:hypothetical protein
MCREVKVVNSLYTDNLMVVQGLLNELLETSHALHVQD